MNKLTLTKISVCPAPFSEAGPSRIWCRECGAADGCDRPYRYPLVSKGWTGKLLVVGAGHGEALALMKRLLRKAGYSITDVAFLGPLRCDTENPSMRQLRACRPFLLRAIERLRPGVILACGKAALRAITNVGSNTNIMHVRGRLLSIPGIDAPRAFATFDPESILRGNTNYEALLLEDIRRAAWPELPWPKDAVPSGRVIGVDTEFTDKEVLTCAVADSSSSISCEVDIVTTVGPVLTTAERLVGHNIFVDIDAAMKIGAPIKEKWLRGVDIIDTLLLARMVDENRGKGGYDLETQLLSYYNARPWKQATEEISSSDPIAWGPELRRERCRLDAWAPVKLAERLEPLAKGPVEFTHRIAATLHRIKLAGLMLDGRRFEETAGQLYADRERARDLLTKAAFAHGMVEFEPTNDGHLRELLFKRLKLGVIDKTKTGLPSVSKTTLSYYKDNEVVKLLTEFNEADKICALIDGEKGIRPNIVATYEVDGEPLVYLATNINPLGARTYRRSSSRPNMQNWKPLMRRLVRSRWKGGMILDVDYRSLEPFILGWVARDDKYLEYFKRGKGYVGIAKEVYGREVEKGTRDYRVIKAIVLGTNYGAGAKKIAKQLWIELGVRLSADYTEHEREVAKNRRRYLDAFPGIKRFMERQRHELLTTGKIVTLTGRVRHMPVPQGEDTPGFGHFLNSAYNVPIQSLASDVTGSALVDVEEAVAREYGISYTDLHRALLTRQWPEVPLAINEIHDELVFDLPPEGVIDHKRAIELIIETMKSVPTLRKVCPAFTLTLDVESFLGPTWGLKD